MTASKKNIYIVLILLLFIAAVLPCFFTTPQIASAADYYTDVMEDLHKDESFDAADYPAIYNDYSIKVIQIAESLDRELFIYVYQPAADTKTITANSINISTDHVNLKYRNYRLSLCSRNGVFAKYRVESFEVVNASARYYDISAIYRPYMSSIDSSNGSNNGSTISSIAVEVAQLWTAVSTSSGIEYLMEETEVIVIENQWAGELRYYDGYSPDVAYHNTDVHFVGFSTDRPIEKLLEVDLTFNTIAFRAGWRTWATNPTFVWESREDPVTQYVTITADDIRSNPDRGWFNKSHTWECIRTKDQFVAEENLTQETELRLKNCEWVVSFAEYDYTADYSVEHTLYILTGTYVEEVTIMRLKYETDGKVYNLGAVSNKVTSDGIPDNVNEHPSAQEWFENLGPNIKNWFKKLGSNIENRLNSLLDGKSAISKAFIAFLALVGVVIVGAVVFGLIYLFRMLPTKKRKKKPAKKKTSATPKKKVAKQPPTNKA